MAADYFENRYNYPGVTNQIMVEPQTYTHLAKHPNIVGCKMLVNFIRLQPSRLSPSLLTIVI